MNLKRRFVTLIVMVISMIIASTSFAVMAAIPSNEYDHLTTTKKETWLTNYHMTNVNQIQQGVKGGEEFQQIYSFAISQIDPNYMLYATDTSGIYYTKDGGKQWYKSHQTDGWTMSGVAFYPDSNEICFAQLGDSSNGAIWKSEDCGETWRKVKEIYSDKNMRCCSNISFGKKDETTGMYTMYIGSLSMKSDLSSLTTKWKESIGVFKSIDGGETFESVGMSDLPLSCIYTDTDLDVVLAANDKGIFASYDEGETWIPKNKGLGGRGVYRCAINPKDHNNWVLAARKLDSDPSNKPLLYMSYNAGESWEPLNPAYENNVASYKVSNLRYTYPDENGNTTLLMSLFETNYSVQMSFDNGKTFVSVYNRIDKYSNVEKWSEGWYAASIAVTRANSKVFQMGGHGNQITFDGGQTFERRCGGISGLMAVKFLFKPDGRIDYIGALDVGIVKPIEGYEGYFPPVAVLSNLRDENGGTTGGKSSTTIAIDPKNPKHIFSVTGGGATYGEASTIVETPDIFDTCYLYTTLYEHIKSNKSKNIFEIEYSPTNSNVIYAGFFLSEDNGKSWKELERRVDAVSPFNGDIVYNVNSTGTIYISKNRGKKWTATTANIEGTLATFAVQADLFEDYVIWIGERDSGEVNRIDLKSGERKVFGKENGIKSELSSTGHHVLYLKQNPRDKNHLAVCIQAIYEAASYLMYETYDGGETWEKIPVQCGGFDFNPYKSEIWIGNGSGVWIYDYELKNMTDKESAN